MCKDVGRVPISEHTRVARGNSFVVVLKKISTGIVLGTVIGRNSRNFSMVWNHFEKMSVECLTCGDVTCAE